MTSRLLTLRIAPRSAQSRGISIIESLCALAILATVVGTAAPSFESLRIQRQLDGMAAELETDIQFARSEAVRSGQLIRLSLRPAADGTCYILHTGRAADCTCSGPGPAQCVGDARQLRTVRQAAAERITLTASSASVAFDATRATVTPTATWRFIGKDGRAVHQVVNIMGRVRSCSPQGKVVGYRPC